MNQDAVKTKVRETLADAGISLQDELVLASLDMILAAVRLEKAFGIKFELGEISLENFSSVEKISSLIVAKL